MFYLFSAIFASKLLRTIAMIVDNICAFFNTKTSICAWITNAWIIKKTSVSTETVLMTFTTENSIFLCNHFIEFSVIFVLPVRAWCIDTNSSITTIYAFYYTFINISLTVYTFKSSSSATTLITANQINTFSIILTW